nr:MAG TPA: FII protein [Caudoviricetes sp.]
MLTLSTSIRTILSHLDRSQTLTELPGQLVQIITKIRPVMIRDLLPSGLSSLMHCINPALETGRERLELNCYNPADRDPESRERGHNLGCSHDGHEGVCSCCHLPHSSRGVGVVTSSHQSIRPVGFSAV